MKQRAIKFRAWGHGEMIYSRDEPELFHMQSNGMWSGTLNEDKGVFAVKDFPIMQYTGLTDKNGVEIYEGDIIKSSLYRYDQRWKNRHAAKFDVGVVVYDFGCYKIEVKNIGKEKEWYQIDSRIASAMTIEILGNIHENPELLEQ